MKNLNETARESNKKSEEISASEDDNALIQLILNGNTNAYEHLVTKYQKAIYNLLFRMFHSKEEALELTQAVFVKAYLKLNTFCDNYKFFSWIYRIAVNEALTHLKKAQRYSNLDEIKGNFFSEELEEISERQQLLQNAIQKLPEKYKVLIIMKYYDNIPYKEIAQILKTEEKKVRSRLFDARDLIRKNLIQHQYFKI